MKGCAPLTTLRYLAQCGMGLLCAVCATLCEGLKVQGQRSTDHYPGAAGLWPWLRCSRCR